MIRAVIFDCFGVLTTGWWEQIREEFFSQDENLSKRALDLNTSVNAGYMSYDEYLDEICKMSGLSMEDLKKRINSNSPNWMLLDYIRDDLKPKYKIGMLSNAAANWLNDLLGAEQVALFDAVVLSYEIGAVKPDPVMYKTVADRLGVQVDECLFVDDSERYCAAAGDLGMLAIYHQNTKDTILRIKETLDA